MKLKTLFVSILAATCLGIVACNPKEAPKSTSEIVEPSSQEPIASSEEPIASSEELVTSSEEPTSSETPTSSEEPAVVNDGSLEHPFTVSEAYTIAETLEAGKDCGVQYFIKGKVTGDISFYKGRLSFDFTDGEKTLYVYNMNNEENKASYVENSYNFATGDELTVAGTLKNYNGKLEICYVKNVADCYRAA